MGTTLGAFNGADPNGVWSLFVADDFSSFSGSISGGWRLTIVPDNPVPPPQVVSITPNGDIPSLAGAQRSRVVSLVVAFDQAVQLDVGALTLALHTGTVRYNGIDQPGGMGAIPALVITPSADNKTWVVTFAGANTEVGNTDQWASLLDGVYDFKIDAALVHPFGSPNISMLGNMATTFHRLFGDTGAPIGTPNGTATDYEAVVNTGDNLQFRGAFNSAVNYKAFLDLNGDGIINSFDNFQFRNRFNKTLTWQA